MNNSIIIKLFALIVAEVLIFNSALAIESTEIYDKSINYSCAVMSIDNNGNELRFGSGFIINKEGNVVTNAHVIVGADNVLIECNGNKGAMKRIVKYSKGIDLVEIETNITNTTKYAEICNDKLKPGSIVYTVGNPYRLKGTITIGLASSYRDIGNSEYLQISTEINPGNSGGAVIDSKGAVVGVATSGLLGAKGLNFAVPIYVLKNIDTVSMDKIIEDNSISNNKTEQIDKSIISVGGYNLGSSCHEINEINGGDASKGKADYEVFNPHGHNGAESQLFGDKVYISYECRDGILIGGGISGIAPLIAERTIEALNVKYGTPQIQHTEDGAIPKKRKNTKSVEKEKKKHENDFVGQKKLSEWRFEDGSTIVSYQYHPVGLPYANEIILYGISYHSESLKIYLERKEILKASLENKI